MKGKRLLGVVTLAICALVGVRFFLLGVHATEGEIYLRILDVGQGSAMLITTSENKEVLIDVGFNGQVLRRLGNYQWFFDRVIDMVILSHFDQDHVGAVPQIMRRYQVDQVLLPRHNADTHLFRSILASLAEHAGQTRFVSQQDRIFIDEVCIDVLWPEKRMLSSVNRNESSLVLRVVYGETSALVMGDVGVETERILVEQYGQGLKSDVLVVGHHGSRTSTSKELLSMVQPQYAVISAGVNNRYGHPHDSVLNTLYDFGIPVLRTDTDGDVEFVSNARRILIQ